MRWMLDTDVTIALLKGSSRQLERRIVSRALGSLGISSITLAELQFGVAKSARPEQNASALRDFTSSLEIAAFGEEGAIAYGPLRRELEAQGMKMGALDTLIAAHAISADATLVTHNMREFGRVRGLRVEDWLA